MYHHSQCCCRKGWSPRTCRVEERLEEGYEKRKIEEGEEKLRDEIRKDKERRARVELQRGEPCFRGPLLTSTPAQCVGSDGDNETGREMQEELELDRPPAKATLLKAQFSDGEFYKAEVVLVRAAKPRVKVRILEGPGTGLEIYEAPSQLQELPGAATPLGGGEAVGRCQDSESSGDRGCSSNEPPPPPQPTRLPPHSLAYQQRREEGEAGGHQAEGETQEEQTRLLAAGPDFFGDVEDASRLAPTIGGLRSVERRYSSQNARGQTSRTANPGAARPPWERDEDFDETSYHEG